MTTVTDEKAAVKFGKGQNIRKNKNLYKIRKKIITKPITYINFDKGQNKDDNLHKYRKRTNYLHFVRKT